MKLRLLVAAGFSIILCLLLLLGCSGRQKTTQPDKGTSVSVVVSENTTQNKTTKPEKAAPPKYLILYSPYGNPDPVYLYEKQSLTSRKITRLQPSSRLEILEIKGQWFRVKTIDKKTGWVTLNGK